MRRLTKEEVDHIANTARERASLLCVRGEFVATKCFVRMADGMLVELSLSVVGAEGVEVEEMDPRVTAEVKRILKERGFTQYQD